MKNCGFYQCMLVRAAYASVVLCVLAVSASARADVSLPGPKPWGAVDLFASALASGDFGGTSSLDQGLEPGACATVPVKPARKDPSPLKRWLAVLTAHPGLIWIAPGSAQGDLGGSSTSPFGSHSTPMEFISHIPPLDDSSAGTMLRMRSDQFPASPPPADLLKPPRAI